MLFGFTISGFAWILLYSGLIIIGSILGAIKLYFVLTTGFCTSTSRLNGKTVIITGANTGIGKETAIDLAKRGARVILACRDSKRAAAAKDDIIQESGNKNVIVRQLDLASLKSVRKFASDILKSEPRLDILINNAGCALLHREVTEDGLECQMQSNYFGHFLLTNLLLGLIIKTGTARIINVSSIAHTFPRKLDLTDLNFERSGPASADLFLSIYGVTKLCNVLFTKELANRLNRLESGKKITVNSLHPGVVSTEIIRFFPWKRISQYVKMIDFLFTKTAKEGAQTTIHLAVADEVEGITGAYFSDCKVASTSQLAKDIGLARKLWELSQKVVGLNPEEMYC